MRRCPLRPEPTVSARPIHAEFRLDWLVRVARLANATPDRRLNAVENLLSALTQPWSEGGTLVPTRDIRLSPRTARALATWVQRRAPAVNRARERLLAITTGETVDNAVPDGWIRVFPP